MKDLLVLLLYHAKCERKKIFFMPESKKSSKVRIWNIKESKEKLETFYFFMLSLEQILLHRSVDLKKLHWWRRWNQTTHSSKQQMFLRKHNLLQQKLKIPERKLCVYFTMEIQQNLWTHWDTKDFTTKFLPAWLMFSFMFSHLLLLHQNLIASGCSTRFVNGKTVTCYQMNRVGRKHMGWLPISTDEPPAPEELLKVIRCNCNTDCSSQRCSCKKHGMKCSLAYGNCRGSACQNAVFFDVSDDEELIE